MVRKLFGMMAVGVLAVSLVGCGGGEHKTTPAPAPAKTEPAKTEAPKTEAPKTEEAKTGEAPKTEPAKTEEKK